MKNREKYAEEIKNYNGKNFCREFIKPIILKRESCNGLSCERCAMLQMLWLNEEYESPAIEHERKNINTPLGMIFMQSIIYDPKLAEQEKSDGKQNI